MVHELEPKKQFSPACNPFAKALIDSGVTLEKVTTLLGHSNLNTTRIYTTPGERDLEEALKTIEEF